MSKRWGATGTVVISSPLEVDELMCKVPKGKLTTINQIREHLAKKHGATICCPLTTGIFARIAAEAAEEQKEQGKKDATPYWRTLKKGGIINRNFQVGLKFKSNFWNKTVTRYFRREKSILLKITKKPWQSYDLHKKMLRTRLMNKPSFFN